MKIRLFALLLSQSMSICLFAYQKADSLRATVYEDYVLTFPMTTSGPVPTVFDPNGIYPYVSFSETSSRPVLKKYRFVALENMKIKITICPDMGGKVYSLIHKSSGKEVLYVPEVIRPTRILPRFSFVAGGIEVSFPVSHTPVQNETVFFKVDRLEGRYYITCGERELRFGMQWSVEYSLGANDEFLTQRVVYFNPGKRAYPWMSWSNAALTSSNDTEFHFPGGDVLSHSSKLDSFDWKKSGPRKEADIKEMTGYFWKNPDVNAFGAFTPSTGTGLYHIADRSLAPGMKLWSYGTAADSAWAYLSTAKHQPYVEIQGGPIGDQSIKLELRPNEKRYHTEFWIPTDKSLDIRKMTVPAVQLRPLTEVPLFSWPERENTVFWIRFSHTSESQIQFPSPPPIENHSWPPSGMENLGALFEVAINKAAPNEKDRWKYYYGVWLAGIGDTSKSIAVLRNNSLGIAKLVLSRMLRINHDLPGALETIEAVTETHLILHPQVVVERDKLLRVSGDGNVKKREKWLARVSELQDEWIIERRVQLLIDQQKFVEAKDLLLNSKFQRVHQTYTRTHLWKQLCARLSIPCLPVPPQLGEDALANFGAYREFE